MFRFVSWFSWLLIRILLSLIFYGTPLIGLWLASSLAAYQGGPSWIAWAAGLLLFPVIPGIWELHAWAHRSPEKKPWFTTLDRLSIRTFAVGLVFLAVMLCVYPQTAFVSLSTRGDWMLDTVKDARADSIRRVLFSAAGGLEWLYRTTKSNPYRALVDSKARQRADEATKQREKEVAKQQEKDASQTGKADQHDGKDASQTEKADQLDGKDASQTEKADQLDGKDANHKAEKESALQIANQAAQKWPWKNASLEPVVSNMPTSVETSINSVAHYMAKHETDPLLRIKALHDYVVDRVSYDTEAFYSRNIPDQDAESVFKKRKSVCSGYANLLSALAAAIGDQVIVVIGDARDEDNGDKLTGMGHAWNAARIRGHWYLIDACWDSGYVSRETGFTKCYKLDYFLPPPEVMIQDHFPDEQNWQLLAKPLSQGEFLRQPMLRPSFQAADLRLISPRCVRNETGPEAMVIVKNPKNRWLMADLVNLEQNGKPDVFKTNATNSETAQFICPLPSKGTYRVNMFSTDHEQYGTYAYIGSVDFVNR